MRVRLAELLAGLSLTIDLGGGAPMEKGLRTCVVATRLADDLELDPGERRAVFRGARPDRARNWPVSAFESRLTDREERAAQYG